MEKEHKPALEDFGVEQSNSSRLESAPEMRAQLCLADGMAHKYKYKFITLLKANVIYMKTNKKNNGQKHTKK